MYIIISNKKHKATVSQCKFCHKDYIHPICRKNRKYCSIQCFHKHKSSLNTIQVKCAYCEKELIRTIAKLKNSKSGLYFCNRSCKTEAQKIGGIKEIQPPHYGTTSATGSYRQQYIYANKELYCKRCNYKEFESSIEIHHIDKNRNNNSLDNLIALCACCHNALHHNQWDLSDIS